MRTKKLFKGVNRECGFYYMIASNHVYTPLEFYETKRESQKCHPNVFGDNFVVVALFGNFCTDECEQCDQIA